MSALSDAVAKIQADVVVVKNATFANAGQALATLEADVNALSSMLSPLIAVLTDLGIPVLTDDQKTVVAS